MQENAVYRYLTGFGQANLLAPSAIILPSVRAGLAFSGEADPPWRTLEWVVLNTVAPDSCAFFDCFRHRLVAAGRCP